MQCIKHRTVVADSLAGNEPSQRIIFVGVGKGSVFCDSRQTAVRAVIISVSGIGSTIIDGFYPVKVVISVAYRCKRCGQIRCIGYTLQVSVIRLIIIADKGLCSAAVKQAVIQLVY